MTKKIFKYMMVTAMVVLMASLLLITGYMYSYHVKIQEEQTEDELEIAATAVEQAGESYLENVTSDNYRITWVDKDGTVLYDTDADAKTMENHAQRNEIQEAFKMGKGSSVRYSATLLEQTVYSAKRLEDGTVLRISVSRFTMGMVIIYLLQPFLMIIVMALVLSGFLSGKLSKRIVEPFNNIDLENSLENDVYEELAPMLRKINNQKLEIGEQLHELNNKTEELEQITENMKEGFVLLDERGFIININYMAKEIFGIENTSIGTDFITVDRSRDIQEALSKAEEEGHSETKAKHNGAVYHFDINKVESDGEKIGTVILAFDITEREYAEQMRREFTANVSHELKTPLQGIIGSAELIENGMVKQEDVPRFITHIREDAARLVTLTGDIIRLSQLDEGVAMQMERVELMTIAGEVITNLSGNAKKRHVDIIFEGEQVIINGVSQLIYEVIYNLCDNAIKYNIENGKIKLQITSDEKYGIIEISDTGIGIAPEHQKRIFERFYRVDKSHSRASGGTGLGLSIVKHAVSYHDGSIDIKSVEGEGTAITVRFPLS